MNLSHAAARPLSRTICIVILRPDRQANLAKVGVHKYAADPSTEVLCAAYAVNNGPVK